jgi:AraC-like DNA-binding protein
LIPQHQVGGVVTTTGGTTVSLRLSRDLLRRLLGPRDIPVLRVFPASDPVLQLLSAYLGGLASNTLALRPATAALAGHQACELFAHLLDPASDSARSQRFGGIKAVRIEAILAGIEQHLCDPALNASWLGARLAMSERYVHHLLAEAGLGFSDIVRRKRLELAHRMLREHTTTPRRIVDIAFAVGFGDLSTFNRLFRRHFGRTPSDVRRDNVIGGHSA